MIRVIVVIVNVTMKNVSKMKIDSDNELPGIIVVVIFYLILAIG